MNNAFSKIWIIGILAVVLAGGILAWQKLGSPQREVKPPENIQNETSNWKTYRNDTHGFEFRYPLFFNVKVLDSNALELFSDKTDRLSLKIKNQPFDGFRYINQSGGFSFTYSRSSGKWTSFPEGVDEKFAPQLYETKNSIKAYVVKTGDAATEIETAFIEDPSQKFIVELVASRNGSWRDCTTPCPEEAPFGDKNTIFSILDTFKFVESKQALETSAACEDKLDGAPVITSLSSYSGSVGAKLEINGCNFSGFEGDKNAWIENSQGVKGLLRGEAESTSKLLKITLKSPLCQKDTSYSGQTCDAWLALTPGIYKIYTLPWGKKSNEVIFTIK